MDVKKVRKLPLVKSEFVLDNSRVWHALAGNPAPPEATGLTRGIVSAGIMGLVNAIVLFIPIDSGTKVELLFALTPAVTALSFVAFSFFDRLLSKWKAE